MNIQFCNKNRLAETTGLSPETFKKYRLSGTWIEGIHWQRINTRCVLYNQLLIIDWIANRNDPKAHLRTIDAYQAALPSNQPKKRGRKAS